MSPEPMVATRRSFVISHLRSSVCSSAELCLLGLLSSAWDLSPRMPCCASSTCIGTPRRSRPSGGRQSHPIPKAGKDPEDVSSYRPISLTSHIAKLLERMVAARVTHLLDRNNTIPTAKVGFRRGRSAEENLGRLIQEVQDGWNRPSPRGHPIDDKTAARYVLSAFDFSRAYDVIDHQMLTLWSALGRPGPDL